MRARFVIITAGGSGVRMNTPLPKQFAPLLGTPLLMHTIEAFFKYDPGISIILVLPLAQIPYWEQLCKEHNFSIPVQTTAGGPERFHSVKNGLKLVPENAVVAIHDGVRPLVSGKTIAEAFYTAEKFGNAIPVVPVTESVRVLEKAFNKTLDRDSLRIVQTPQCFLAANIKKAYLVNYHESFTDDASVLEKTGERILLCEGNRENIKITTPEDLQIAEAILMQKKKQ
ncbi:MAG: 2-C-methyl-D-erythritol 4-phosphate cytidylyltransferase [Bacteroidetes bacterium]|nr:MAG: 2-C-methyl-D-erythritol 4-phosphate cytidylyltransferase [Bacteroidota bacterium]